MSKDVDVMLARAQIKLGMVLVCGLIVLVFGVIAALFFPGNVNDKLVTLAVTLGTGLLGLAGQPIAYFFARHRPQNGADPDGADATPTSPALPANQTNPTEIQK